MDRAIIEIRAGAGGEEAAIFAAELARMYQHFAERKGWRFLEIDSNRTPLGGYKTFIGQIQGPGAYDELKYESGVHRIQRIPKTERSGRVHTSTASVAILPEVEPKEVDINPGDLEITFFRTGGPGGQNVNKVESGVRIVHRPTGVTVSSQVERSQQANRERAMSVLRSKIYEEQRQREAEKTGALRREQIGSAERAEKIRTYNFPDDRITDHRIGKKWHNIEKIMNGDLEPIVSALKQLNRKEN
jgi:peptide chain release factor 1